MIRMVSAGVTNPGRVRSHNEDAFLDAPDRSLWVVADGMGGHSAGDVASAMIVESMGKLKPADDMPAFVELVDADLSAVNEKLRQHARERNVSLIGATVVALLGGKDFAAIGWAGDSRVYRFKDGKLEQMSRDHSTAQELMDTGQFTAAQLAGKQQGNTITRAVGGEEKLYLDWVVAELAPGTQFMLCSDGLTKEVPEPKIEEEFKKDLPPKELATALVDAALAAGGRDNVTVVVVRTEGA
ncbi:MAG: PP2C family protein-serine/threonine phosphatase [Gammaproteobacteria bacterium]